MSQIPPPPQPFGHQNFPPQPGKPGPVGYGTTPKKTSGAAVTSLICGILGCVPVITGLIAIITGFIGIRATRSPSVSGRGMAITGLILGLLSLVGWGAFFGLTGAAGWAAYSYGKEGRELGRAFAQDLAANNVDAALARCTSKITRKELTEAATTMKTWGTLNDTTLFAAKDQAGGQEKVGAFGMATFATGGQVPYALHMVKEGGVLKVDGFILQHAKTPVSAGTVPDNVGGSGGDADADPEDDAEMEEEAGSETQTNGAK